MERTRGEMGCDTDLCATNVLEDDAYLVHLLFEQRVLDEVAEHKSNMLASSSCHPDKEWEPKLLTEYKEAVRGDANHASAPKETRSKTSSTPKWQQLGMPIIKGSQLEEGTWNTKKSRQSAQDRLRTTREEAKVTAGRVAEEDATIKELPPCTSFLAGTTLNRGNTGHELAGPGCKRDVKPLDTTLGYFVLWLLVVRPPFFVGWVMGFWCFGSRLGVLWPCFFFWRGERGGPIGAAHPACDIARSGPADSLSHTFRASRISRSIAPIIIVRHVALSLHRCGRAGDIALSECTTST